jgi:hypothetical protein
MDIGKLLESLVQRGRILKWAMLAVMASLVVLDLIIPSKYDRFPWESIGGFGAVFGLFSCFIIIIVSKALGYAFLYGREDYYDD